MFSVYRKEIVDTIQQIYWLKVLEKDYEKPKLNIYGISVKELANYITTEKDLIRRIYRIPEIDFLLNNDEIDKTDKLTAEDEDEFDFETDEWLLIDK
jgi:hypothetical protein